MSRLRHLAVLLDGNRRWALRNGVPESVAYVHGAEKVKELLAWCVEADVEVLTVMATSADNMVHRDREVIARVAMAIVETLGRSLRTASGG